MSKASTTMSESIEDGFRWPEASTASVCVPSGEAGVLKRTARRLLGRRIGIDVPDEGAVDVHVRDPVEGAGHAIQLAPVPVKVKVARPEREQRRRAGAVSWWTPRSRPWRRCRAPVRV